MGEAEKDLDRLTVNSEADHILEEMTNEKPGSERYGALADQLKTLKETEMLLSRDEREERSRRDKRLLGFVKVVAGFVTAGVTTVGALALDGWLHNRDILPTPFARKATDEIRQAGSKWGQSQMEDDRY